jgi:tRNA/rRNA methyltransferase
MATTYPSLNLAQSVMVTAYELSFINPLSQPGQPILKSGEGFGTMKKQMHQLLQNAGIAEGTPLFHRIMERIALAGPVDIPLFLSVLNRLNQKEE